MIRIWESIKKGYLRLIEPVAALLIRHRVSPNVLTTVGTLFTVAGGLAFATGHIRTAGWIVGLTAIFDVLDGTVARRTGQATVFGAFYDSTLDRVADGALLGGIAWYFATDPVYHSLPMLGVTLFGIVGTFLVSYARARAEGLGLDAKVGVMQRAERVVLISAPQAFFGLALNGWVFAAVVILLAVTAWITVVQRVLFVRRTALTTVATPLRVTNEKSPSPAQAAPRRAHS
ncbi:MAG TPA: CDP-alcohol phosphatidyltransferase family protein [Vicinamibacterales bacterium]|nr:CDP-alcohol phosphatidyltransferase family protein [Vicinamibacterales bacterium]